jgi:hypothetical protein
LPARRRARAIISTTKLSIVRRAAAIFLSGPTSNLLISFQHGMGMTWRRKIVSNATSVARMKGTSGSPVARHPVSTPKTRVQVRSNANLGNASCRSYGLPSSAARARNGKRLFSTLSRLHRDVKARNRGAVTSIWAFTRWRRQDSPSEFLMPAPRRTSKISAYSWPLG